jgi:hypothetical protein
MAKKQTRRSISVSRTTYERLKAFCESSGISMSQFVETRVGDFLGEGASGEQTVTATPVTPRPMVPSTPRPALPARPLTVAPSPVRPVTAPAPAPVRPAAPPMTSAAARYAVEPPPPIIKKAEQPAPKAPSMPKADQIFTF